MVNILLRQFVREKELVLSAKKPNAETRRAIKEAEAGIGLKTFKNFKEFERHIHVEASLTHLETRFPSDTF